MRQAAAALPRVSGKFVIFYLSMYTNLISIFITEMIMVEEIFGHICHAASSGGCSANRILRTR